MERRWNGGNTGARDCVNSVSRVRYPRYRSKSSKFPECNSRHQAYYKAVSDTKLELGKGQ